MPSQRWMTDVHIATNGLGAQAFGNRPLNEITIPGTHDAGCYTDSNFPGETRLSKTQSETITLQLAGGIRYFDLRPKKNNQEFWTYHGPYWGGRLDGVAGIIQDVANFMAGAAALQELVVLNFSHFNDFTGSDHLRFINEILLRLGPFLVPHNQNVFNLFNSAYDVVLTSPVGGGAVSRVAVLYDGALDQPRESLLPTLPDGFFKLSPKYAAAVANQAFLFDKYADKANLGLMQTDQMTKLSNRAAQAFSDRPWAAGAGNWTNNNPWGPPPTGIPNTWHLFSWTLTPQGRLGSPLTYAQNFSNPALEDWFTGAGPTGNHWPIGGPTRGYDPRQDQRINVIYVDDYASRLHVCLAGGCPRAGYAAPVALSEFINRNFAGGGWPGWAGNY